MTKIETGGPAFPTPQNAFGEYTESMSLRDYFAAAALSSGGLFDARDLGPCVGTGKFGMEAARIADVAYGIANAMLQARSREGNGNG